MADLRGKQLKDSYQNVVTRGTGNKLENGNGVEFADLDDKASLSTITLDLSTDSSFTAGVIKGVKIGGQVTLTLTDNAEHSSVDSIATSAGFIPSDWQPNEFVGSVYSNSGSIRRFGVQNDGSLQFFYIDFDGSGFNRTSSGPGPTISYNVD